MRYFKELDSSGHLLLIGTGYNGVEITKEEYEELQKDIEEICKYQDLILSGELTFDKVPEKYLKNVEYGVQQSLLNSDEE